MRIRISIAILFIFSTLIWTTSIFAQIVFSENFNMSQGVAFTTSGPIGTSSFYVSKSGDDWGARIHDNLLELTNTSSAETNVNGWIFVHTDSEDFLMPYESQLNMNSGIITWEFNLRQIRTNPAGFNAGSYGVAFIIGATSSDVGTTGSGYALVLGNTGSPDPIRFVS